MKAFLETLLTVLTLTCLASLGYFIFAPDYSFARSSYPWIYFLIGAIFFNTTHIFITFLSLKFVPEISRLSFLKTTSFRLRCALVFISTAGVSYLCLSQATQNEFLITLFRVFVYATTVHHTLMQTYGLSVQMDLKAKSNLFEKKSVLTFTFISIALYAAIRINPRIDIVWSYLVLAAAWTILGWKILKTNSSLIKFGKFIYLARYLCVFLCFIHPVYTLLTMTFHGLEYLQTFIKSRDRSAISSVQFRKSSIVLWSVIPLTALFIHFSFLSTSFGHGDLASRKVILIIESLVMGFNLLHFFIDAKIYKFADPEVRQNVGILFNKTEILTSKNELSTYKVVS